MKTNLKDIIASNLISVIIIFLLLSLFDHSGRNQENTFIIVIGFLLITAYDLIKLILQNRDK